MLRRLILSVALVAGLLAVAAAGLVVFRIALAEAVLSSRLASLGVPAARLTVASLGLHRMVVRDISLGRDAELRIDRATLNYRPGALFAGRIEEAAVNGLRLRLDLGGAEPLLGSLQPLLERGGGAAGAAAPIPGAVLLSGGRIEAETPDGEISAALSAAWRPFAGTATLDLSDFVLPQVALETSRLHVEATRDRIVATATAQGRDDALDLDLRATVDSYLAEPTLALALEGSLAPAAWRAPPLPAGGGRMTLSARLDGRLQPFRRMVLGPAALDWILGADLRGRLQASLRGLDYRGVAHGISGTLDLAVSVANGALDIEVADEGRIGASRLDPALLDAIGVPQLVSGLQDAEVTVTLPVRDAPLRVRLHPTAEGADLAVSGTADAASQQTALELRADGVLALDEGYGVRRVSFPQADIRLRDLTVDGYRLARLDFTGAVDGPPAELNGSGRLSAELGATRNGTVAVGGATVSIAADFRRAGQRFTLRQRGDGSGTVASFDLAGLARIGEPIQVRLTDAELTLDAAPGGLTMSHAITMQPEPVTVAVPRTDGEPLALRADAGTVRLNGGSQPGIPYRGEFDLGGGRLEIPGEAIVTEDVSASVVFPPPPDEPLARFAIGRITHTATPAYFAPLRVDGEVARRDDTFLMTGNGTAADGAVRFSLRAEHDIANGRGTLRMNVPETALRKGGLQPGRLSPLLGDIHDATGRIGAVAEVAWGPGGAESSGMLDLADLSFTTDAMTVEGLTSRISLDGLLLPSTPPGQRMTVRRIDPGLPLDDVAIRFRVEAAGPPRLRIEEARAGFAGGRLSVVDAVLDASRPHQDLAVGVDGIELAHLLGLLKVEGVSGTGRLSGTVPVVIAEDGIAVRNGQLAAEGPGVLRVRSEAAASVLGGAGEQVGLMLSALEDFHYDALSATLDMEAGGDADIAVHMRGNNPAVLDGYPFAFNVGLGGNLVELIAALRKGARFSTDLVRPQLR